MRRNNVPGAQPGCARKWTRRQPREQRITRHRFVGGLLSGKIEVREETGTSKVSQTNSGCPQSQVQGQPPGLYQQALNAVSLSKQLVARWLEQYMFAGEADAAAKAQAIVDFLGDHNRFLSHARRVDIKALADLGAKVFRITDADRELWQ